MSLIMENRTSEPISSVVIKLTDLSNIKVPGMDLDNGAALEQDIAVGASVEHRLTFDPASIASPQTLSGSISYKVHSCP